MENISLLAQQIHDVNEYFRSYALKQVNNALTVRNWLIGCYIVSYEQSGNERAAYGDKTLSKLSLKIKEKSDSGFSDRTLRLYRQFYLEYPQVWNFIISRFKSSFDGEAIWQLPIAKLNDQEKIRQHTIIPIELLMDRLSFTHIIELLKMETLVKRSFYEMQAIKNNWTVAELKRNISSLLYERIGLSTDKKKMLDAISQEKIVNKENIVKSPYILEFLGIEDKSEYSETDLEQAIINHLQKFLTELGRGFCFEARQKRITFNNTHYRIDLVFYHRILKCHILLDLKIGEFDHSDAGQMNVYLNYYKENEMSDGDNPPIGIILCSQKDSALVHYATGGLPQEVFVSKYLLQLPSEKELKSIIQEDVDNFEPT